MPTSSEEKQRRFLSAVAADFTKRYGDELGRLVETGKRTYALQENFLENIYPSVDVRIKEGIDASIFFHHCAEPDDVMLLLRDRMEQEFGSDKVRWRRLRHGVGLKIFVASFDLVDNQRTVSSASNVLAKLIRLARPILDAGDTSELTNGSHQHGQMMDVGPVREGRTRIVLHLRRERRSEIIRGKKQEAIKSGNLYCEACGFDFGVVYGSLGRSFIECHHTTPLADLDQKEGAITSLEDLALLCANCHRMIHRMLLTDDNATVEKLRALVQQLRNEA